MNAHLIIFILALVGAGDSLYLIYERKKKCAPICVIGTRCETVWLSPHSRTLSVGNEVLGIIFYSAMIAIEAALFFFSYDPLFVLGEAVFLATGFSMSCYFIYLQWRVIRAWCFWCTVSAFIVWVMLAVRFLL